MQDPRWSQTSNSDFSIKSTYTFLSTESHTTNAHDSIFSSSFAWHWHGLQKICSFLWKAWAFLIDLNEISLLMILVCMIFISNLFYGHHLKFFKWLKFFWAMLFTSTIIIKNENKPKQISHETGEKNMEILKKWMSGIHAVCVVKHSGWFFFTLNSVFH